MSFLTPKAAGAKKVFGLFVLKLSLVSSPHSFLHQFLNFHSNTPPRSANLLCNTDYRFFGGGVGAGRKGSNREKDTGK